MNRAYKYVVVLASDESPNCFAGTGMRFYPAATAVEIIDELKDQSTTLVDYEIASARGNTLFLRVCEEVDMGSSPDRETLSEKEEAELIAAYAAGSCVGDERDDDSDCITMWNDE